MVIFKGVVFVLIIIVLKRNSLCFMVNFNSLGKSQSDTSIYKGLHITKTKSVLINKKVIPLGIKDAKV